MKLNSVADRLTLLFLAIAIAAGVGLRFTNLEGKVYWIDEVHTSLRAAGYSRAEFVDLAPSGEIFGIEELQKFQQLTPERGLDAGIEAIASSEHSPLYYVLARVGMELFGANPGVTRGVAAALGLLLLPAMYWLCQELFKSQFISLTVTALAAASPIQILYSQEAREYSLLAVTIAVASALFWRMSRDKAIKWWWYGIAIALGFYTQPLFLLVVMAHGVYALIISSLSWSELVKKYLKATALGIVLFIPWLLVFIFNEDGVGMWIERDIPLHLWLQRWLLNISATFFDWQAVYQERFFDVEKVADFVLPGSAIAVMALFAILLLYCVYFLLRYEDVALSLFLLTLMGVVALALALPDLIFGGQRSTVARYIIGIPLVIQIFVGYCLASNIAAQRGIIKQLWRFMLLFLVTISLLCSWKMVQSPTWWNKYSSYYNPQVAEIINQAPQPLIISNRKRISRSTSLSYELKDNAKFLLLDEEATLPEISNSYDVFLFRPYPEFLQRLQDEGYAIDSIFVPGHLYRLVLNK